MTGINTATNTIAVPAEALGQARAKLEKAHSLLWAMKHAALHRTTLFLKDSDGSLQGYYGHLKDINAAIEEMLAATAQANQIND